MLEHSDLGTLFLGDIAVSGTHRQTIGFTVNGGSGNLHRHTEVFGHTANNSQLLVVFDTKDSFVRLNYIKQFAYHGGNPFKMTGTAGTAEHIGHSRADNATLGIQPIGVHLGILGMKQIITAAVAKLVTVPLVGAGILVPVFIETKLQGIHKDRADNNIAAAASLFDQRQMAIMEVAHGRHKANSQAFEPRGF